VLDHSCQTQRRPNAERGLDLYETPAVATRALLRVENLPRWIWEPAAGRGALASVLRAAGHEVLASDNYGVPSHFAGHDFLAESELPDGVQAIVTNPPFQWAEQFVAHALDLCPHVVMLCGSPSSKPAISTIKTKTGTCVRLCSTAAISPASMSSAEDYR
jgi:hypothetical protein